MDNKKMKILILMPLLLIAFTFCGIYYFTNYIENKQMENTVVKIAIYPNDYYKDDYVFTLLKDGTIIIQAGTKRGNSNIALKWGAKKSTIKLTEAQQKELGIMVDNLTKTPPLPEDVIIGDCTRFSILYNGKILRYDSNDSKVLELHTWLEKISPMVIEW